MSDPFPTFGTDGTLLGNLTSSQGAAPSGSSISGPFSLPDIPALPSIGGNATQGGTSIAAAASSAGITGGSITPAATTGSPAAATNATVASSWFARGAVVILGLVFVAVGLSQFGVLDRTSLPRIGAG